MRTKTFERPGLFGSPSIIARIFVDSAVIRVATATGLKDGPIFPLGPLSAPRVRRVGYMCCSREVNRRGPFGRRASLTIKQCQDCGKGTDSHDLINNNKQNMSSHSGSMQKGGMIPAVEP